MLLGTSPSTYLFCFCNVALLLHMFFFPESSSIAKYFASIYPYGKSSFTYLKTSKFITSVNGKNSISEENTQSHEYG